MSLSKIGRSVLIPVAVIALIASLPLSTQANPATRLPLRPLAHMTLQSASRITPYRLFTVPVRHMQPFPMTDAVAPPNGAPYIGTTRTLPAVVQNPTAITYDQDDGNFYVLDHNQSTNQAMLLRIRLSGATTLFVSLSFAVNGIAYDHATKMLYLTSQGNYPVGPAILAVSQKGVVTLLAGGGAAGQQDGKGAAASFEDPTGITVNTSDGALYVTDADRIRRITTGGSVTTFTSPGSLGMGTSFQSYGIVYDPVDKNLYVAEPANNTILQVTPAGSVAPVAGQCIGFAGSCTPLQRDGRGAYAAFASPSGITVDPTTGALYVTDFGNNSIRKIDLAFNVTTIAGNGLPGTVDGVGQNAEFDSPVAIAYGGPTQPRLVVVRGANFGAPAVRTVIVHGTLPPPVVRRYTLFDTPTPGVQPYGIDWHATTPRSPYLWYTDLDHLVARLTTSGVSTEYPVPSSGGSNPSDIVMAYDGTAWFLDPADQQIDHINASGQLAQFPLAMPFELQPFVLDNLARGPDRNIWFVVPSNNGFSSSSFGYVTPQGAVTQFSLPLSAPQGAPLVFASDNNAWIAASNSILRVSRSGQILNTYNYPASYLTRGPDGNVWFTQSDAVGTINPVTNVITVFPIYTPVPGCQTNCSHQIGTITTGPDGALWFTEQIGFIGRITTGGVYSQFQIFAARTRPSDITSGPDGNIWFTDTGAQKLGRLNIH